MNRTAALLAISILAAALALSAPALAYDEVGSGKTCVECHGVASPTVRKGPHGGYTATTKKCKTCHTVHVAPPSSIVLLPGDTIKATCNTCHDGTAGGGVYGTIVARGLTVASDHSIDTTDVVPGGDEGTGGDMSYTFGGESDCLTCSDCHSPHDSSTVDTFTGDRSRSDTSSLGYEGNRLLKQRPNGSAYAILQYGSDWCGACHKGRLTFGSGVNNHPVESTAVADYYYYEVLARVDGHDSSNTETGTLGRNNRGYVMPVPRTSDQSGHYPVCMQCHEDARSVGDVTLGQIDSATESFTVTASDGTSATDNPRFQDFPHESPNAYLLVETDDDLCINCHDPGDLP